MHRVAEGIQDYAVERSTGSDHRAVVAAEGQGKLPLNQALQKAAESHTQEGHPMRERMLGERRIEVLETALEPNETRYVTRAIGIGEEAFPAFPSPRWHPTGPDNLFLTHSPDTIALERFRSLRTRMLRMRENRPLKTVLVVSAQPGEGKTLIAANLAQVMAAHTSERVLLIDGDLRCPRLHELLGAPARPGLQDCLRSDAGFIECIQQSPMSGLFFMPAGDCANRSAALLGGSTFAEMIVHLRRGFEWIVIDSPAALAVSDAAVMAEHCDGVLMVVRAGSAEPEDLKQVSDQFEPSKLLGVVLNGKTLDKQESRAYGKAGKDKGKTLRA